MDQQKQARSLVQLFLIIVFIGMGISAYTLWHHVALAANALSASSFCNISETVNCDAVALSSYSEVFGYPVAALALIFYGGLMYLGLAIFFLPKEEEHRFDSLRGNLFNLTLIGLIPTIVLAIISFTVLGLVCMLCIGTYIVNIALALVAAKLNSGNQESFGKNILPPKESIPLFTATCFVFALSFPVAKGLVGAKGVEKNLLRSILVQHFSTKPAAINTKDVPTLGDVNAPIAVVEYSDFQCPYCARAATTLGPVVQGLGPKVKLISKQYPLDPSCNSGIPGRGHPQACLASKAAHCVFKEVGNSAYFQLKKKLYENQASLSSTLIKKLALESTIDETTYESCIKDQATHEAVVAQIEEGSAAGVTGTPSVFINGRKLENGAIAEVLKAALKEYLKQL